MVVVFFVKKENLLAKRIRIDQVHLLLRLPLQQTFAESAKGTVSGVKIPFPLRRPPASLQRHKLKQRNPGKVRRIQAGLGGALRPVYYAGLQLGGLQAFLGEFTEESPSRGFACRGLASSGQMQPS